MIHGEELQRLTTYTTDSGEYTPLTKLDKIKTAPTSIQFAVFKNSIWFLAGVDFHIWGPTCGHENINEIQSYFHILYLNSLLWIIYFLKCFWVAMLSKWFNCSLKRVLAPEIKAWSHRCTAEPNIKSVTNTQKGVKCEADIRTLWGTMHICSCCMPSHETWSCLQAHYI